MDHLRRNGTQWRYGRSTDYALVRGMWPMEPPLAGQTRQPRSLPREAARGGTCNSARAPGLSGKWSGRTLYGCTRCAATGMTHFVHLKQRCTGQAKGHRIWVAKQLQNGKHPNGKDVVARIPGIQLLGRGRRAEERWRRSSAGQPAGRDPGPDHNRSDPGGPEWSPAGEGALHTKPPAPRDPGTDQSRIDPFGPEWSPVGEGELDEPSEAGAGCTEAWIEPPQWEC